MRVGRQDAAQLTVAGGARQLSMSAVAVVTAVSIADPRVDVGLDDEPSGVRAVAGSSSGFVHSCTSPRWNGFSVAKSIHSPRRNRRAIDVSTA